MYYTLYRPNHTCMNGKSSSSASTLCLIFLRKYLNIIFIHYHNNKMTPPLYFSCPHDTRDDTTRNIYTNNMERNDVYIHNG